jgi:hypothetical protein
MDSVAGMAYPIDFPPYLEISETECKLVFDRI